MEPPVPGLKQSPAYLRAVQLRDSYFHQETLGNTPANFIDGRGDSFDEDFFLDNSEATTAAMNRVNAHLRKHPELEQTPEFKEWFKDLGAEEPEFTLADYDVEELEPAKKERDRVKRSDIDDRDIGLEPF